MRIALFGADGFTCQLPRIAEGFKNLGRNDLEIDINPKNLFYYDLAYCNNPPFDDLINCKSDIKIANILDIPEHLIESGHYTQNDLDKLKNQLLKTDVVTAISHTTANQLKKYLNINVSEVIYNPIKPVYLKDNKKKFLDRKWKYLYVGRANDPNKRFNLIIDALRATGEESKLAVVGSENPNFGNYLGVISDDDLNDLYNDSQFLIFPSRIEGIGLPMIEAAICGCVPITCLDNKCAKEFLNHRYSVEPNAGHIVSKVDEIINNLTECQEISPILDRRYYHWAGTMETYYICQSFEKEIFEPHTVAQKILNIYEKEVKGQ